jgi:hypothetical protein
MGDNFKIAAYLVLKISPIDWKLNLYYKIFTDLDFDKK